MAAIRPLVPKTGHSATDPIAETVGRRQFSRMKMATPTFSLLLPLLAACQQPIQSDANRDASPSASSSPRAGAVAVINLTGEWRVAGIDGHSVEEPIALSLTGDENQLWWQPRCAGMARAYRIDGQSIAFGSTEPPRRAGELTPPVCAIGLPPQLDEVFRALDGAKSIARSPSNGVLISGPNHSLLLFSQ